MEAIVFYDGLRPIKTLLYSEFEAVVQGVLGLVEFSNKTLSAAYVAMLGQEQIKKVVLFRTFFDVEGFPDLPPVSLRDLSRYGKPWLQFERSLVEVTNSRNCRNLGCEEYLWSIEKGFETQFLTNIRHVVAEVWGEEDSVRESLQNSSSVPSSVPLSATKERMSDVKMFISQQSFSALSSIDDLEPEMMAMELEKLSSFIDEQVQGVEIEQVQSKTYETLSRHSTEDEDLRVIQTAALTVERTVKDNVHTLPSAIKPVSEELMVNASQGSSARDEPLSIPQNLTQSVAPTNTALLSPKTSNNLSPQQKQKNEDTLQLKAEKMKAEYQKDLDKLKQAYKQRLKRVTNQLVDTKATNQALAQQIEQVELAFIEKDNERRSAITKMEQYQQQLEKTNAQFKALQKKHQFIKKKAEQLMHSVSEQESGSAKAIAKRLQDYSVVLVIMHPVAGHISLRAKDFEAFNADPEVFLARHFKVDIAHYQAWMKHWHLPVCEVCEQESEGHSIHLKKLEKISSVNAFVPGKSDRCEYHQMKEDMSEEEIDMDSVEQD